MSFALLVKFILNVYLFLERDIMYIGVQILELDCLGLDFDVTIY